MTLEEKLKQTLFYPHWKKIGIRPRQGITLPLFSLHTAQSCGIGEFLDLLPLIDWCKQVGFDLIQLLPLNDSGEDPSPYNALSSCALHPLYLSLHALPYLPAKSDLEAFRELNRTERVSYAEVSRMKKAFLFHYCASVGALIEKEEGFHRFLDQEPWVKDYARYKAARDQRPGREVDYQIFQYLATLQLESVHEYAKANGIALMGDLPILISRESCDVQQHADEFDLSFEAGAPPDFYNKKGQVWGFPLYRWDVMEKRDFSWWTNRLRFAERFYDLYRIDHVLGLFRIWAVPPGEPSRNGHFQPSDETLWLPQGRKLLNMLAEKCRLLPIAEDLGTLFEGLRPLLLELGIPGTKVMRWERNWEGDESFIVPSHYSAISLTCVSTHDSETLAQWWRDYPSEAAPYAAEMGWPYHPILSHEQRLAILKESHCTASLFHANLLQEYLALTPYLVAERLEDERINLPGTLSPSNWTYRFKPSVEELKQECELNNLIISLLS